MVGVVVVLMWCGFVVAPALGAAPTTPARCGPCSTRASRAAAAGIQDSFLFSSLKTPAACRSLRPGRTAAAAVTWWVAGTEAKGETEMSDGGSARAGAPAALDGHGGGDRAALARGRRRACSGADAGRRLVEAAPINPSDLGLLLAGGDPGEASFGGTEERPVVTIPLSPGAARASAARVGSPMPVGNEGRGDGRGGGIDPVHRRFRQGRGCCRRAMYGQYRAVDAGLCLELPAGATAAEGAASFVNPMTVLGMIETMRSEGHTAIVHTAAASNLGQMLERACREEGIGLVDVVRSPGQA